MDGNISQGTPSKHTISNVNNGCSTYGHRESVVNLELGRLGDVALDTSGQEVEEHLQQVQVLPGHVGHLEDWTHPARQHPHNLECPRHSVMLDTWKTVSWCFTPSQPVRLYQGDWKTGCSLSENNHSLKWPHFSVPKCVHMCFAIKGWHLISIHN